MSSGYDLAAVQWEARRLDNAEMVRRSNLIQLNHQGIMAQPPQAIPPAIQHTPVYYPPYQLGYQLGATIVALPSYAADPIPVANQSAYMSQHTYHMFTAADLPPLLFRIEPTDDTVSEHPVPILVNADTQRPVVNFEGAQLRYFSFLPRWVASNVSGALLEFWFRLDYRLEMNDIRDRIQLGVSGTRPTLNTLSMKRTRWREDCNALAWRDCRTWAVRGDLQRVGRLSMLQICFNTTMLVDLPNRRFLKPSFSDAACKPHHLLGYVDAGVPANFFVTNLVTTIPTRRMYGILALRHRLQELAIILGHGREPENYLLLADDYAPIWWNDRMPGGAQRTERVIEEITYPSMLAPYTAQYTHSEYMLWQIGDNQAIGPPRRQRNRRR